MSMVHASTVGRLLTAVEVQSAVTVPCASRGDAGSHASVVHNATPVEGPMLRPLAIKPDDARPKCFRPAIR